MRTLLAMLATLTLLACGEDGPELIDPCVDASSIQVGMSAAEIRDLFGPPLHTRNLAATWSLGQSLWEYDCLATADPRPFQILFRDDLVIETGFSIPITPPRVLTQDFNPQEEEEGYPVVVDRVKIKVIGRDSDGWTYAYQIVLRNRASSVWRVKAAIEWRDANDFALATETFDDFLLTPDHTDTIRGSASVPFGLAGQIVAPWIRWEWRPA